MSRAGCTAPRTGHRNETARAQCPVCGPGAGSWWDRQRAARVSPPTVLTQHMDAAVAQAAAEHAGTGDEGLTVLAGHENARVRAAVARNSRTPEATLRVLAAEAQRSTDTALAQNPNLPEDLFATLAAGPPIVRRSLAGNPSTPGPVYFALCADPDERVSGRAIRRRATWLSIHLGVATENAGAIDLLLDQNWGAMTPDSEEVRLALHLFPNP